MLALVVFACLLDEPKKCEHFSINIFTEETVTNQQCMSNSITDLAKWSGDHPAYRIVKWTCTQNPQNYGNKGI